jgi:peptide/nickel transport system substrate-binding protein
MDMRSVLKTGACAAALALAAGGALAQEKVLRWSSQGDAFSMDPYVRNESLTLGVMSNVYEGLTRRDTKTLEIQPGLAIKWEQQEPTRWRFWLRQGVKFHDGRPFTADDVVFSFNRVRAGASDLKTRVAGIKEAKKVDDFTVDFITDVPNPIIHYEWDTWYMLSASWAKENHALETVDVTKTTPNFASTSANGTGPYLLTYREADVRTEFAVNPSWWDAEGKKKFNVTKVVYRPVKNPATAVAALLSGQIDVVEPVPVQDIDRINKSGQAKVQIGPELRTIFLGMDTARDELVYSDVKGKNPLKDKRVRQAFYQAIDMEAIKTKIMRGLSVPSAMMIGDGVNGYDKSLKRLPYDPAAAKKLLTDAGYPNGFGITLDCPNDRYVNDEAICQAVVGMLARIGVKVTLNAQSKTIVFPFYANKRDTSFYMLGWTPGSVDSWNVLYNIVGSVKKDSQGRIVRGLFNYGSWSSPQLDDLTDKILVETDKAKRDAMIAQAWKLHTDDIGHLPLHQQALAWGVRNNVNVVVSPFNRYDWSVVTIK